MTSNKVLYTPVFCSCRLMMMDTHLTNTVMMWSEHLQRFANGHMIVTDSCYNPLSPYKKAESFRAELGSQKPENLSAMDSTQTPPFVAVIPVTMSKEHTYTSVQSQELKPLWSDDLCRRYYDTLLLPHFYNMCL